MVFKELPQTVKDALQNRAIKEQEVQSMSAKEVFDEYCNWHGLIRWGGHLFDLAISLNEQEQCEKDPTA